MACFSTRAMKSAGVYRASADFAKCGFAEMKFSGEQWIFVKLQRPPPEIRIFFPARSARSSSATRRPRLPASMAHISPAAPAPRIKASYRCGEDVMRHRKYTASLPGRPSGGARMGSKTEEHAEICGVECRLPRAE